MFVGGIYGESDRHTHICVCWDMGGHMCSNKRFALSLSLSLSMYSFINTYTHIHIHVRQKKICSPFTMFALRRRDCPCKQLPFWIQFFFLKIIIYLGDFNYFDEIKQRNRCFGKQLFETVVCPQIFVF